MQLSLTRQCQSGYGRMAREKGGVEAVTAGDWFFSMDSKGRLGATRRSPTRHFWHGQCVKIKVNLVCWV